MEARKYNCLVVDDEPIARKIIANYIEQLPFLELAAEHTNALSTMEYLRMNKHVDFILLDINMPNLSGLQLIKIVQPNQPVIFTTAYSAYAVESYELNAVDYLLKPFSFERFTKAVYKAVDVIENNGKKIGILDHDRNDLFFIKSDSKNYPVLLDDILYCEAMKNYTVVILKGEKKLMPLISLSKFEAQLLEAGGQFIQVHRSFIVSKKHITAIGSNYVTVNQFDIPIGVQYKEDFLKKIGMKAAD